MAETRGFEPPIGFDPYNGLANRRLQPLGHVSGLGDLDSKKRLEDQFILFKAWRRQCWGSSGGVPVRSGGGFWRCSCGQGRSGFRFFFGFDLG